MAESNKNLDKFKKSFNYDFSIKKVGLILATLIFFFTFNENLVSFIANNFFIDKDFSFFILDLLIVLASA